MKAAGENARDKLSHGVPKYHLIHNSIVVRGQKKKRRKKNE